MKLMTNTTASRVVASIPIWFVVFLIVVFGGLTFGSSDDWRVTTLGAVLLAVAAVLSALILFVRRKGGRAGC
jgi:ABC-type transport system involved in cytochrome c biogenesis permease component